MKILLYFESEKMLQSSGIGRALKHQQAALTSVGIEYTTDPWEKDYDVLHINTVGINSESIIKRARKDNKPIIYHAHSTEEDFKNSFVLSNQIAPLFKKWLLSLYPLADEIITPTPYSKKLLEGYGINTPINALSNGIDLSRFEYNEEKVKAFKKYFNIDNNDKVILSVGLYFERKGILDFVEIAKSFPEYKFIWFGYTSPMIIPRSVREVTEDYPKNVFFPGYVKGPILEGAFMASNCFFFPSYEETEGIVVLEALAAKQEVLVRDIGVFDTWLEDGKNCYKAKNNEEFISKIKGIIEKELPSVSELGYITAKDRGIESIGKKLKVIYERVLSNVNKQGD
ncbi:MAG: glycosyltransferase family 4 protein [Anaerorhabdus sp.]